MADSHDNEKLKMHSPDLTQGNIEKIRELFPGCVTEAKDNNGKLRLAVDFDQLRQELSDSVVEGPQERYHLNWPGKREALLAANAPITKTLRPCREKSVNFDTTQNLFIEGDNLEALKLLQETYLGKVKMIYIDPPYNTGRDFIYDDDYKISGSEYLELTGQEDELNKKLVSNTESNGRFHSDWISMMYSRLKVARKLLSDDGAIFISIDDNENHNLRSICDEIFGSENFIATIIWHKMDSPKNSAKYLSEDHDYILLYSKNSEIWRPNLLPRSGKMVDRYQNPDNDPRGPWLLGDLAARNFYSKGIYEITTPSGNVIPGPPAGSYWRVSRDKFDELNNDNRIWWGKDGTNRPGVKKFLSEVRNGVIPQTYWHWKEVGSTRNAKQQLSKLMSAESGDQIFVTPKPVKLISRMIEISTNKDESAIVMDFFAGSGTTAQAVGERNLEDGGDRKWILVQLPERAQEGVSIADICRSRINAFEENLIKGDLELKDSEYLGYRSFFIDSSSFKNVFHSPGSVSQKGLFDALDNINVDRSGEDLLFQVLIDSGVDLALPVRADKVGEYNVFYVDENALVACFDSDISESLIEELAKCQPIRAVFRDLSFSSDSQKINVTQLFKQYSPHTEVKVI
ncbi:site-specific DNA-methyltransferase [Gilvimarinus xylanilyticus]|uniref:site-specific DNA-methyltransferase (adenine-specific) n=1 Tax=Gilvimarinus xylanilyticus TaxID=2944139 RepID=A0A9X2I5H1_9GAMM|nr:site-specific DNA-methyltransferase [Gilvimarinus xylanilyticus]MCP8899267.1 site-specific DNA-methyltransferase [Gilvimarinus xylanilyticus]